MSFYESKFKIHQSEKKDFSNEYQDEQMQLMIDEADIFIKSLVNLDKIFEEADAIIDDSLVSLDEASGTTIEDSDKSENKNSNNLSKDEIVKKNKIVKAFNTIFEKLKNAINTIYTKLMELLDKAINKIGYITDDLMCTIWLKRNKQKVLDASKGLDDKFVVKTFKKDEFVQMINRIENSNLGVAVRCPGAGNGVLDRFKETIYYKEMAENILQSDDRFNMVSTYAMAYALISNPALLEVFKKDEKKTYNDIPIYASINLINQRSLESEEAAKESLNEIAEIPKILLAINDTKSLITKWKSQSDKAINAMQRNIANTDYIVGKTKEIRDLVTIFRVSAVSVFRIQFGICTGAIQSVYTCKQNCMNTCNFMLKHSKN